MQNHPFGTVPLMASDDPRRNHFERVVMPATALPVVRPVPAESMLYSQQPEHSEGPLDLQNHHYQRTRARYLALRDPNYIFARSGEATGQVVGWYPEY